MAKVGVKGLICITIEQFFKARRLYNINKRRPIWSPNGSPKTL